VLGAHKSAHATCHLLRGRYLCAQRTAHSAQRMRMRGSEFRAPEPERMGMGMQHAGGTSQSSELLTCCELGDMSRQLRPRGDRKKMKKKQPMYVRTLFGQD
jgi:hypothetical protein